MAETREETLKRYCPPTSAFRERGMAQTHIWPPSIERVERKVKPIDQNAGVELVTYALDRTATGWVIRCEGFEIRRGEGEP